MSDTPTGDTPQYPPYAQYPDPGWQPPASVKPGVVPLRPLALGEILDGAISTIRAQPKLLLGVSALVATVTQLLSVAVTWTLLGNAETTATAEDVMPLLATVLGGAGLAVAINVLAQVFMAGFATVVVGRAVLGQRVTFAESWRELRPRLLPLLGLTLLFMLVVGAGALLVLIPGVWLYVRYSLSAPALVLERQSVGRAFNRSAKLVSGSWWRVFGILLLAAVIAGVIGLVLQTPFSLLSTLASNGLEPGGGETTLAGTAIGTIGAILSSTLVTPFTAAVTVLLYFDQRMRREAMDIELARVAGFDLPGRNPAAPG